MNDQDEIKAIIKFNRAGELQEVLPLTDSDGDERILMGALGRLIQPGREFRENTTEK